MTEKVVTRFAPSPTGMLHIGGIRTALFAYLFAKKHNGIFLLRIEDTDKKREVMGAVKQIMDSLTFLGIEWDFGPDKKNDAFGSLIQSERLPVYHAYAKKLIETGYAYVDPFTEEEVNNFRAIAEKEKRAFLFRDHRPETLNTNWSIGKSLRFKVKKIQETSWYDEVRGHLSAGTEALDDFILIKEDGFPTYNFCHIVDDIEMSVTYVMRGEEFIASTPKFLALYEALGKTPPHFVTLPPVLGESGTKKLSKRDGAKSVLDYKDEGYLSDALFNFLAFVGWNPGGEKELYTKEELILQFSIEKIQKSGAKFNPEKLDWYNKEYLKLLPLEEVTKLMLSYFSFKNEGEKALFEKMAITARERAVTIKSFYNDYLLGDYDYLTKHPIYTTVNLIWKKSNKDETLIILNMIKNIIQNSVEKNFEKELRILAEEKGNGEVLWPLRVSLSGKEKSPDPFTLLTVLGKDITLTRLQNAINSLNL